MLVVLAAVPARAQAAGVGDWAHVWEVVQLVSAQPPAGTIVYYFGDSVARESIGSDEAWTRQLQERAAAAGRRADVVAYTLAGHSQTFGMDRTILGGLPPSPAGQPQGIVLIGLGVSRFIGPPLTQRPAHVESPSAGELPVLSPWARHHYDDRPSLSAARKRKLAARWMERRWAGFRRNRAANLAAIELLIQDCVARGLRPVLFELPLNRAIVGGRLDRPRSSYRSGCLALARAYGADYISLQDDWRVPNPGFWDIHHLVRPGYERWQSLVSDEVVGLLPRL
jgi:hypothetical protein